MQSRIEAYFNVFKLDGSFKYFKLLQKANAPYPISYILSGNFIIYKLLQFENTPLPYSITV